MFPIAQLGGLGGGTVFHVQTKTEKAQAPPQESQEGAEVRRNCAAGQNAAHGRTIEMDAEVKDQQLDIKVAAAKQPVLTHPLDKFAQARRDKKIQKRKRHRARLKKPHAKG